jgi:uncharacterized protein (TIGR02246 family)
MLRSISVVLALVALPLPTHAQQPSNPTDARAGITATWAAFKPLWVAGNVNKAVATFFTDDAINMVPGAPTDSGRAAIEKGFAGFFASNKVSDVSETTDEVQVAGRTAYERGTFRQTVIPAGGQPSATRARYLAVWIRQADGKWKCARFLFNNLPST